MGKGRIRSNATGVNETSHSGQEKDLPQIGVVGKGGAIWAEKTEGNFL